RQISYLPAECCYSGNISKCHRACTFSLRLPGRPELQGRVEVTYRSDASLFGLKPHMHLRGKRGLPIFLRSQLSRPGPNADGGTAGNAAHHVGDGKRLIAQGYRGRVNGNSYPGGDDLTGLVSYLDPLATGS